MRGGHLMRRRPGTMYFAGVCASLVGFICFYKIGKDRKWFTRFGLNGKQYEESVVVFTKYPQPGLAKTRLIPYLGEKAAGLAQLVMSNQLLVRLGYLQSQRRGVLVEVQYYGGNEKLISYWLKRKSSFLWPFQWRKQEGKDLGDKMKNAFLHHLNRKTDRVVIVGCDIPGITPGIVAEALETLKAPDTDMVLGKAADGGYYLVGLNQRAQGKLGSLFSGVDWGTDQVLEQQWNQAQLLGVQLKLLVSTLQDVDLPEDLHVFESETGISVKTLSSPSISVVMPVLNEENNIEPAINAVVQNCTDPSNLEVVVVDGGSTDGTVDRLTGITDNLAKQNITLKLIHSAKGRGQQLCLGAEAATGQNLLFLHSDSRLPSSYDVKVQDCLNQPGNVAGAFKFSLDILEDEKLGRHCSWWFLWKMRIISWGTNIRALHKEMPYGDQSLFMSRQVYQQVGGFPDWLLMEDVGLVEKLVQVGHICIVEGEPCVTSARRWQKYGAIKITSMNLFIITLYKLGISPATLARLYYGKPAAKQQ